VALADGYRESTESGRICCATAAGVGCAPRYSRPAMARWDSGAALRKVFPQTREQRCWFHEIANVLAALPNQRIRRPRFGTLRIVGTLWMPSAGSTPYTQPSFPRWSRRSPMTSTSCLAFYDYPAEHWIHLRTTNPIESTFSTVRHRTKVTKGPGSRAAGLAMAFKLIESTPVRWRSVNAPRLWSVLAPRSSAVSSSNDPMSGPHPRQRLQREHVQCLRTNDCTAWPA
jgi:hypothetical protein